MPNLETLDKAITRVSRVIALLGLVCLLMLALATVSDVFLRWIFNSPITGVRDAYSLFIAVVIASCFALCIAERNNITIRFFGNFLGPKVPNLLEAFGHLATMLVFGAIAWQLWVYTNEMILDNETTHVLGWPVWPWWRIVTILFGICVLVQAVVFLITVRAAFPNRKEKSHIDTDDNVTGVEG